MALTGSPVRYEWNDGELIKFVGMKKKHLKLIQILSLLFDTTNAKKEKGLLICEQDVMLSGTPPAGIQIRRPGMAYFSNEQIRDEQEEPVPAFCIEVISTYDQLNDVKKKLIEYFKHGVQVAWVILPEHAMVEVYTSIKNVTICMGSDICSAHPVLDDFEISVDDLLK